MKEIKMEYSEYEAMVKLIEGQEKAIEEFKKESRVVLIDERYFERNSRMPWCNNRVPKIISTDDDLAKEYMKAEFDNLSREFVEVKKSLVRLQENDIIKERESKERKKSSWWQMNKKAKTI